LRFAGNTKVKTSKNRAKRNADLDLIFVSCYKFIKSLFTDLPLFIKLSICVCIIICISAVIFIPQVMLPETTDIVLNDNGFKVSISAKEKTVGELLENTGVILSTNDYIDYYSSAAIEPDMEITIYRAMQVNIETGPEKIVVPVLSGTVEDTLKQANIELGPDDEVYPSLDEIVTPGTTITHILVTKEQKTETQAIGYKEVTKKNASLEIGKEKVTSNGSEGLMETTFEITYKNGIETKQEKLDSKVVKKPVNKVIEIGTKPKPTPKPSSAPNATTPKLTPNPKTGTLTSVPKVSQIYSSSISAHKSAPKPDESIIREVRRARKITAYCGDGRTASGTYPKIGTIACYWKIPGMGKGTKIYVPGYGYGVVEDQGANKNVDDLDLDLFFGNGESAKSAANKWGRKYDYEFYILK